MATKNQEIRDSVKEKLLTRLSDPAITPEQELQIALCLEGQFNHTVEGKTSKEIIKKLNQVEASLHAIDIIALKKRVLILVKEQRKDWVQIFINIFLNVKHSAIKDYLCKELNQKETKKQFLETIDHLFMYPEKHPECFLWLFQKIVKNDDPSLPYSNKEGQCRSFESFLILMSKIENNAEYKDLTKKLYNLLSEKRYALVRAIMEGASLEFIQEFLLLASKCHTLNDHDKKILHSLASVVQPSLGKQKNQEQELAKAHILWTTEEGYLRTQEQIRRIGTIEIIENAREIEAARALGDLRENSEYKFALEKRSRLQGQLKTLSEQLGRARIITKEDIHPSEVGVGSIVDVVDGNGHKTIYTILGPWDADIEKNILSFQSQLAQAMLGCKKGETFKFRNQTLKIGGIRSFLEK